MKRTVFLFLLATATVLLLSSCIIIDGDSVTYYKTFNSNLHGTWKTSYPESVELRIDFDKIIITGTVPSKKPLNGFIRDFPLDGYSEESVNKFSSIEGNLKIKNAGEWYTLPYAYQESLLNNEVLVLKGTSVGNNLTLYKQ